jgi:hypothetical protein
VKKFNWIGFFIIIAGILWLLGTLGVLEPILNGQSVFQLIWPAAIIVVGISNMAGARRVTLWGVILSLIGLYFLSVNLGYIGRLPGEVIFPAIVIAVGLAIFIPGRPFRHITVNTHVDAGPNEEGFINSTAVFGGDERRISGSTFRGANITAAFGGVNLDLSGFDSCLPRTEIDMTCAFGGVELVLPPNTRAERGGLTCVFGGMDIKGPQPQSAEYVIVLNGVVAFGGLDVKYPIVIKEA